MPWRDRPHPRAGAAGGLLVEPGGREVLLVLVAEHLPRACRAPLRARPRVEADDGAVDGASPPRIVPVLRPVFTDGPSRLADVLEVGAAEVLMLLYVEPKV